MTKVNHTGDLIRCPRCGQPHEVKNSVPPLMLWYKCGGKTYFAGANEQALRAIANETISKGKLK